MRGPGSNAGAARQLGAATVRVLNPRSSMGASESKPVRAAERLTSGLLAARAGKGPLVQRDYWAVIARCRESPSRVVDAIASHFPEFAGSDMVAFRRPDAADRPLVPRDELD